MEKKRGLVGVRRRGFGGGSTLARAAAVVRRISAAWMVRHGVLLAVRAQIEGGTEPPPSSRLRRR